MRNVTDPTTLRVADLVPHGGAMCLLERVLSWDEDAVHLATRSHLDPGHPLRRDGHLDPVHLCEYGAQAMAVHGGLLAHRDGGRATPGVLVSLRDVWLEAGSVDACKGELDVSARRVFGDASGWQYEFAVRHGGRLLASGRAIVALRSGA